MLRKHNLNLVAAAVVASTLALGAPLAPAWAEESSGWDHDMMMGPGMMGGPEFGFMCNPRHAGMAEWRIKQIEDEVKPKDAQKSALDALRTASTKAAETISAACKAEVPAKSTDRMAAMQTRLEATLEAIKTVRPAFDAFYTTLDDQQRARLDAIGPRRWGWGQWRWPWSKNE